MSIGRFEKRFSRFAALALAGFSAIGCSAKSSATRTDAGNDAAANEVGQDGATGGGDSSSSDATAAADSGDTNAAIGADAGGTEDGPTIAVDSSVSGDAGATDSSETPDAPTPSCSPPKSAHCGQDAGGPGACVDLTSDSNNCGQCGAVCSGSTPVCSNGSCVAMCNTASDQTQCGTECVTLGNDGNNCGACGNACATSTVCSGGVCTPLSSIGGVGCADGTREAFESQTTFPAIAACAGGWDGNGGTAGYTGVFPAPLRTTNPNCTQNGNSGPNPDGIGCSSIDLCAPGWHVCAGGEVIARVKGVIDSGSQTDGCTATTWPVNSFFAASIGSTGYYECAEPYGTVTGPTCTNASGAVGCQANPGLTNDIFGCGSEGVSVSTCGDVDRSGGNLCGSLDKGWYCGTDGYRESVNAVHNPNPEGGASPGGVLCCMSM